MIIAFSNALCRQCWVVKDLECGISGIRQVELSLRAARYSKQHRAMSWAFLAISPTYSGPK